MCYLLLAQIAYVRSWEAERIDALTKRIADEYPLHRSAHFHIAVHRLPRWGGAVGDSAAYAKAVADRISGDAGDGMYAHIALHVLHYHEDDTFFEETKFDEARVVRGLEALCRADPTDDYVYNESLRFAFVRKHQPLAKLWVRAFQAHHTEWYPPLWGSRARYRTAVQWAKN